MQAFRRVQVSSDDIVDATIVSGDIADATLVTGDLANKAVSRPKMGFISQIGSSKPGTVTYGTPYKGGEPTIAFTQTEAAATGPTVTPGSAGTAGFVFAGGAGTYCRYMSAGSA